MQDSCTLNLLPEFKSALFQYHLSIIMLLSHSLDGKKNLEKIGKNEEKMRKNEARYIRFNTVKLPLIEPQ